MSLDFPSNTQKMWGLIFPRVCWLLLVLWSYSVTFIIFKFLAILLVLSF